MRPHPAAEGRSVSRPALAWPALVWIVIAAIWTPSTTAQSTAATDPNAAPARFEAATIKPHNPDVQGFGVAVRGRKLTGVNVSVSSLMTFAFTLDPRQIVDGPGWIESERFDIVAEAAEGDPTPVRTLVQGLLADRFGLAFHRAKKTLPVYLLARAKGGPKLANKPGDANGKGSFGFHALGSMEVSDASMADFAGWMQRYVMDRPVIDRTGVPGKYTFQLTWRSDEFQFVPIAPSLPTEPQSNDLPDLYTALKQQLGLKMESARAPVEVFVIDHLEKPSPN